MTANQVAQKIMFEKGKKDKRSKKIMYSTQALHQAREEYPETLKNISDMDLILSYQLGYIWS
jgi:hypothetical protein